MEESSKNSSWTIEVFITEIHTGSDIFSIGNDFLFFLTDII